MDYATSTRRALINSVAPVDHEAATRRYIENARTKALAILGDRWLLSPNYNFAANYHHAPQFKSSRVLAPIMAAAVHEGRL